MEEISYKIGVVGTGFISKGFVQAIKNQKGIIVSNILTRRKLEFIKHFPRPDLLTNSVEELLENSDLIVECTGDVIYATSIISQTLDLGKPVVTMDAEFQVTTGSYLVDKGLLTEAEGDQPGCLAILRENLRSMGFRPLVYGNIKGFLNTNPSLKEMEFWSQKMGISLDKVVSFTDGTKVQIEQALVANAFGADILCDGLIGEKTENIDAAALGLAQKAKSSNCQISDYVLCRSGPPGIFIVAEHDEEQSNYLEYYKLGKGPFYTFIHNFHLCHLEIIKTVQRVLSGGGVLLNNSKSPHIIVGAVAKKRLKPGDKIKSGIGGFELYGIALRKSKNNKVIPIGLISDACVIKEIDKVEIPGGFGQRFRRKSGQ